MENEQKKIIQMLYWSCTMQHAMEMKLGWKDKQDISHGTSSVTPRVALLHRIPHENNKTLSKREIQYQKQMGMLQEYDRSVHYFSYPEPCTSTINTDDDIE
jgi:hypothetical protein